MSFLNKITGSARSATIAGLMACAALPAAAQDFKWTVQTAYASGDDLHLSFVRLAEMVEAMSGGRLVMEVSPGGAFVPAFDVLDAVNDGVIDAAGGDADYWVGKHPAGSLFASAPGFGMPSIDLMGWMAYGGGKELFDEYINETLQMTDTVAFLLSPAQAQPFGWFETPVTSTKDIKGLKYRTPGLPVDVMREMGAAVVTVPGSEVVPALEQGVIEAAEYFGPKADMILGLPDVRKVYMMPSYLQLGLIQNFFISRDRWEELPDDLQAIVTYGVMAESADFYWKGLDENSKALATMENEMGVQVAETPRDVMEAQLVAWTAVLDRYAGQDEFFAKVLDSQREFAARVVPLKARINPPADIALKHFGFD
ncbi:ABC transporter substrate-binding protein [Salipiger aestuarii]|uniref:TRAP transporter substrate-binding protein n=1 Tax=Salipiger aestuarii TaxID=568098 RepID=UPI00025B6504|nr:TRAP transporter substrate-binding protein [Salipiger aestuarii]EIE50271.1 extracellular solute-binding protein [Citreicella sp. 357]KAA8605030.1 ABC transporter substrate-binding protein [Salipiger aestuarii]KAA8606430.1 ABC transporter substrate-binding protein [Salipiger aestuarii]